MRCIVCNKKGHLVCKDCQKNPFRIEDFRNALAVIGDKDNLKRQYSRALPEIKNLNTSRFWDNKLRENKSLLQQDGMTKDRIRIVASSLPKNAKKILDIGAGHGFLEEYLTSELRHRKLAIYANDFSRESIKYLKRKYSGTFDVQSIYKLKYPENFFDVIFILEVLEHIPPSKILKVLGSIKSLLKKRGTIIVSVPTNEGLERMKTNPSGHVRAYTVPIIKAELEITGFTIKKIKTLYAFSSNYRAKKVLAKFVRKWKPNNIIIQAESSL